MNGAERTSVALGSLMSPSASPTDPTAVRVEVSYQDRTFSSFNETKGGADAIRHIDPSISSPNFPCTSMSVSSSWNILPHTLEPW